MTEEERRAKAWCDAREARKEYERRNAERLAGSPSALKRTLENWKPILSYLRGKR